MIGTAENKTKKSLYYYYHHIITYNSNLSGIAGRFVDFSSFISKHLTNVRARVHARQLRAQFTAMLIMILSTQYAARSTHASSSINRFITIDIILIYPEGLNHHEEMLKIFLHLNLHLL